jgi:hypothetical protein
VGVGGTAEIAGGIQGDALIGGDVASAPLAYAGEGDGRCIFVVEADKLEASVEAIAETEIVAIGGNIGSGIAPGDVASGIVFTIVAVEIDTSLSRGRTDVSVGREIRALPVDGLEAGGGGADVDVGGSGNAAAGRGDSKRTADDFPGGKGTIGGDGAAVIYAPGTVGGVVRRRPWAVYPRAW